MIVCKSVLRLRIKKLFQLKRRDISQSSFIPHLLLYPLFNKGKRKLSCISFCNWLIINNGL